MAQDAHVGQDVQQQKVREEESATHPVAQEPASEIQRQTLHRTKPTLCLSCLSAGVAQDQTPCQVTTVAAVRPKAGARQRAGEGADRTFGQIP